MQQIAKNHTLCFFASLLISSLFTQTKDVAHNKFSMVSILRNDEERVIYDMLYALNP